MHVAFNIFDAFSEEMFEYHSLFETKTPLRFKGPFVTHDSLQGICHFKVIENQIWTAACLERASAGHWLRAKGMPKYV